MMDEILESLYFRLDSNTKYLSECALEQILIKILYLEKRRLKKIEIQESIEKNCNLKNCDIDKTLEGLVSQGQIMTSKGYYWLSTSTIKKIDKAVEESNAARNRIIDKYFSNLNTEKDNLKKWLNDVSIHFFAMYAEDWISDLINSKRNIERSRDDVLKLVENRTSAINYVAKEDKEFLPNKFIKFITDTDPDVNNFLWEFGTSQFSAKLLKQRDSVDELSIEAFKDSICILDTNILIFYELVKSQHHKSAELLGKIFKNFGINPKVFYITKKEYQYKVRSQREYTINNIDNLSVETIKIATDDFTQSAVELQCRTKEDYIRFFDRIDDIPTSFDEIKIDILDDRTLSEIIDRAEVDEEALKKLNDYYRNLTQRDKNRNSLAHDAGLIAGTKYLRNKEKCFILSEDITVNLYAKDKGTKEHLPIAIRLTTLINVLAIQSGGDSSDTTDYIELFANIIRRGLQPKKETFKQEELYKIYEMDRAIGELPAKDQKLIASEIHSLILKGEKEEEIKRIFESLITKAKISLKNELEQDEEELQIEKERNKRLNKAQESAINKLKVEFQNQERKKWMRKILSRFVGIVLMFALLVVGVIYFADNLYNQKEIWKDLGIGLLSEIIMYISTKPLSLLKDIRCREQIINKAVIKRLAEVYPDFKE